MTSPQLPSNGTGVPDVHVPRVENVSAGSPILSFLPELSGAGPPMAGHRTFVPPVVFSHAAGPPPLPPQPTTPVMGMLIPLC